MRSELFLKFTFEASHSLIGNEVPHPHLWRLEVSLVGQPFDGKIVDMIRAREFIQHEILPLEKTYLNTNPYVDDSVRKSPTCESLSQFFWNRISEITESVFIRENRTVRLDGIGIALCSMDGEETGMVRFFPG